MLDPFADPRCADSVHSSRADEAEHLSGIGLKLFGFIAELVFAFIPESRSPCPDSPCGVSAGYRLMPIPLAQKCDEPARPLGAIPSGFLLAQTNPQVSGSLLLRVRDALQLF